jgi:hypothetical protein
MDGKLDGLRGKRVDITGTYFEISASTGSGSRRFAGWQDVSEE